MNIKEIQFKETASQRIYRNYMKRVEKTVSSLSKSDQQEALLEFNSHIYEGFARRTNGNETNHLLDLLEKLGEPEEVLKPLIADKKLNQATRTFNPIHLFKAIALNLGNGVSYIIFGLLYLCLFGFIFLIYAKLKNPNQVGLYFQDNSFMLLGKLNSGYLEKPNVTEILGNWFIPTLLGITLTAYLILTLLLKFKRSINKQ